MSTYTIRVENISKKYNIRPTTEKGWRRNQRILSDDLSNIFRILQNQVEQNKTVKFWALTDVSFEANPGDVIGIIGRNGAGKSTLLKILSRVTKPTSGRAIINGRVGSLLEVGTGFHSELTGRENIFISGAIIGMSRDEIKKKFDEIVEFSGVREFLDTPVKRFSSGMEVRLAFSVAAHLEPEVLLVDEVLAVGDASFQQKSLEKIIGVSKNGGTVLFVSHNMTAMSAICNKGLVLKNGKVAFPVAPINEAIDYYQNIDGKQHNVQPLLPAAKENSGPITITEFTLLDQNNFRTDNLTNGMPARFKISFENSHRLPLTKTLLTILIKTPAGDVIANLNRPLAISSSNNLDPKGTVYCNIKKLSILPGNIRISLLLDYESKTIVNIEEAYVGEIDQGSHLLDKQDHFPQGWIDIENDWTN